MRLGARLGGPAAIVRARGPYSSGQQYTSIVVDESRVVVIVRETLAQDLHRRGSSILRIFGLLIAVSDVWHVRPAQWAMYDSHGWLELW